MDSINSNTVDSNNSLQGLKNGFWEGVGIVNGAGDIATSLIKHPIDAIEGFGETLLNVGKLAIGVDNNGSALMYFQNIGNGLTNLYDQTSNMDPYIRGHAWGSMFGIGAGIAFGPEGISFVGDLGVIGAGVVGREVGLAIATPYGYAFQ